MHSFINEGTASKMHSFIREGDNIENAVSSVRGTYRKYTVSSIASDRLP